MKPPDPNPDFATFTASDSTMQAQTFSQMHCDSVSYSTSVGGMKLLTASVYSRKIQQHLRGAIRKA